MEWFRNRKFVAPIVASFATVLVTIAVGIWPDFPFNDQAVMQFLMWIWAAGLGIPAADALYDQAQNAIEFRKAGHKG